MKTAFRKDPDAVLDYRFVWSDWLDDDTISDHTITPTSGITVDSSEVNSEAVTIDGTERAANTVVTVWLSGGTAGSDYDVTCQIETADGRTDDRTITILVRER